MPLVSPETGAILGEQNELALAIAAYGFCRAQVAAAVVIITLVGMPSRSGSKAPEAMARATSALTAVRSAKISFGDAKSGGIRG